MLPDPDLGDVAQAAVDATMVETWTSLPGKIEKYDNTTQLADVKPLLRPTIIDSEGNELTYDLDIIRNVPIEFPGCGDWFISWPIAVGDTVKLCFHARSLDDWITNGGLVDVKDPRMHHLSDASAWPGLRANPQNLGSDVSATNMVLGKKGGPQIQISDSLVLLGDGAAAAFVALSTKVDAAFSNVVTWANAHVHTGVTTGVGSSGTSTAAPLAAQSSTAATKVKAT